MKHTFSEFKSFAVLIPFLLTLVYWIFLIPNSSMEIKHDALGYEQLGTMIAEDGWIEYFKTGPNREPFYPFTVAVSINIGNTFNIPYTACQKVIHLILFLITQILAFKICSALKIHRSITITCLSYMAISPAIVNSGMSLFSEIAAMPFILLVVISAHKALDAILKPNLKTSSQFGVICGLTLAMSAFCKGIFQYVFLLFAFALMCFVIHCILQRKTQTFKAAIITFVLFAISFQAPIIAFKTMNKVHNGHYEFSNRYADFLFGNIYKRAQPFSKNLWLAHISSVPSEKICRKFFTEEECYYTEFHTADYYSKLYVAPFTFDIPEENKNAEVLQLTKNLFISTFPQQITLWAIESVKMSFWESTLIGFVTYPKSLQKLFNFTPFKYFIRLLLSVLSFTALLYLPYYVYSRKHLLFEQNARGEIFRITLIVFILLYIYTGLYALYPILTRYALPVAPVFLIAIAFFLNQLTLKK